MCSVAAIFSSSGLGFGSFSHSSALKLYGFLTGPFMDEGLAGVGLLSSFAYYVSL